MSADSAGAGFTPGFASTLTCEDGSRHFVKAASKKAQAPFADAYCEEVRKLRALPPDLPVPRLRWSHEDDLWVLLELQHVEGTNPSRPWRPADLDRCLDTLELLAARLSPPPLALAPLAEELAECLGCWDRLLRRGSRRPHLEDAHTLARAYAEAVAGGAPGGAFARAWAAGAVAP